MGSSTTWASPTDGVFSLILVEIKKTEDATVV